MVLAVLLSLLVVGDSAATASPCEKQREAAFGACLAQCDSLEAKARAECEFDCQSQDAQQSCDEPAGLSSERLVDAEAIQAEAAAACHATTPCPEPKSCASWSTYYNCGTPTCGPVRGCGEDCPDPRFCFGPGVRQPRERFRVCFTQQGACTEYQRITVVVGCGCD